jgi:hypothetical protein
MRCRWRDGPQHVQAQPVAPATTTADHRSPTSDTRMMAADMRAPMLDRIKALAALFRQHYGQ